MDYFVLVIKEKNRTTIVGRKQHGFMFGPPSSSQWSLAGPGVSRTPVRCVTPFNGNACKRQFDFVLLQ